MVSVRDALDNVSDLSNRTDSKTELGQIDNVTSDIANDNGESSTQPVLRILDPQDVCRMNVATSGS